MPEFPEKPVTSDLANSPTLPPTMYTDASILAKERERIFSREWIFIGHVSEVKQPGDFMTRSVANENIAVVRNADSQLQAFHNVCRHRSHELLSGSGNTRMIVCPYHAWTYDLSGNLVRAKGIPQATINATTLTQIRVETIAGFVFATLESDAPSLSKCFPELSEELNKQLPGTDNLQLLSNFQDRYKANWKIDIENYLECYHCGPRHPSFRTIFEFENYQTEILPSLVKMSADARLSKNSAYQFSPDTPPQGLFFWYLWPNITINLFPGTSQLSVACFDPVTPDESHIFAKIYGDVSTPRNRDFEQLATTVYEEDRALCESVQRGMRSSGARQGVFMSSLEFEHLTEAAVHHFQKRIWDTLTD